MTAQPAGDNPDSCVEGGIWTGLPVVPPTALSQFALKLDTVDSSESARIKKAGVMTFHMTGCAGDFSDHEPQEIVADAMASQVLHVGSVGLRKGPATTASFLFHLGDAEPGLKREKGRYATDGR